jgi:hypothetical protein
MAIRDSILAGRLPSLSGIRGKIVEKFDSPFMGEPVPI